MYILKCSNINLISQKDHILKNVNLKIKYRSFGAIVGRNGAGKSTLMNIISGLTKPSSGSIICSSRIFHMPQNNSTNMSFPMSAVEFVKTGRLSSTKFHFDAIDHADALNCMTMLGMSEKKNHQINKLSGGEFKKILIARGFMSGASIFLLDEPLCGVDAKSCKSILRYLKDFAKRQNITVLIISHHHEFLTTEIVDSIYVMEEGQLKEQAVTKYTKHKMLETIPC